MNNIDLKVRGGVKRRLEVHQTPSSSAASPSSSSSINRSPGPLRKQLNSGHHRSKIPSVTVKLPGTVFNPSNDSRILLKSSPSSTTALSVKASNGGTTSTVQAVEATKETLSASSLTPSPSYFCPSPSNGTGSTNSSISPTNGSLLQHCLSFSKIRQLVFNLSMCKLSRYRQTPDPSLFKSVLICNTLKRLERELDREGIRINFGPNGVSFVPVSSSLPMSSSSSTVTSVAPNDSSPSSSSPATSSSSSCSSVLQPTLMTPASFSPQSSETPTLSPVSCSSPSASEADISKNTYSVSDMDVTPSGRITPFLSTNSLEVDEEDCVMEDSDDSAMDQSSSSSSSSCSSSSSSSDDSDSGLWSPEPCTANPLSLTSSASLDSVNRVSSWTDSLLALNCISEEECPSSSNASLSKGAHSSVTNYSCPETTIVDAEETTENNREMQSDVHRNHLPSQSCLQRPSDEAVRPPTDSPPLLHLLQCLHQDPSSSSSPSSSPSSAPSSSKPPSSSSKSSEPTSFPESSQTRNISLKESSLPTSSVLMGNVSSLASSSSSSMATTVVAASSTVTSDELFGDIDLSLYDFDLLSPLAAPNENVKLTPVSEEELMSSTVISSQDQEEQRPEKRDFTSLSCNNNNNEDNLSTTSVLTPSMTSMTSSSTTCCTSSSTSFSSVDSSSSFTATILTETLPVPSSTLSDPSSSDSSSSPPSSPSEFSSSTSPTSSTTSTTCATQSSTATVVFSKLFMNKTEGSMYLDDMPVIS